MGHSSKKKKRGGSGRKGKGRATSKDHPSHADDDPNLLSEEITALSAIFQDDFKLVSESPHTQFIINLRPYSNDMGSEDVNVSALLLVRCLPGYPYRCPKLQIVPEKGLSKDNADSLLSLLTDQANFNAQEGRVMIFNLVEVAQEFLSEITPVVQPVECVPSLGVDKKDQWLHGNVAIVCDQTCPSSGQFVYGLIDLFSDLCGDVGSWDWSIGTNTINASFSHISRQQAISTDKSGDKKSSTHTNMGGSNTGYGAPLNHHSQNLKPVPLFDTKEGSEPPPIAKLDVVEEETEDDSKSISPTTSHISSREETVETDSNGDMPEDSPQKNVALREKMTEADDSDLEGRSLDSFSFFSTSDHQISQGMEQDLVMVHLLRLACSSKGPLAHALPDITSELYKLGILSKRVRDLAMEPPLLFNKAFEDAFRHYTVSSPISQFWKASADFVGENTLSLPSSRYLNDFEEISSLGHGGFGHVVLCKNKLDGRQYAVKKIRLKDRSLPVNDKILREVATLSRLQHQHVVRYYQAWIETEVGGYGDTTWDSLTGGSSSCGYKGDTSTNPIGPDNKLESTYLYIQMEYCPRTLRQVFESYTGFDKEFPWHLFRQIVEGLAHIHGQGIIHRDLTPSNIFFDARNDIKIGDFGLAKFLKLEQVDHDPSFQNETAGASMDGTGQVGTYFYTAPEIEQEWPQVNEKVDMYSLGVVFFELWYPFSTAMERHIVLSDFKQKGVLPATWVAKFPGQASLLQRLMSPSPSDRPSAKELLQHELPPRMEDEWLNAYYLNPKFHYKRRLHENQDLTMAVHEAFERLFPESTAQADFGNQLLRFRDARGTFSSSLAKASTETMMPYILRTIQSSEDTYVYERVVSAIFDEERVIMKANRQHGGREKMTRDESSFIQYTELDTELRDHACEVAQEVFRQHGAKRLEITPMRILDDCQHFNSKAVKLLTPGGNMLELCHELRLPFVNWVITNQKLSFKRYEISWVYRRAIGHTTPNRFLQGDFDIIGGAPALTEAETIKVATDIVTRYFHSDAYEIRLNHGQILDAIWSWIGIEGDLRWNVTKLLSLMGSSRPQSSGRKTRWALVRRQLLQDLNLSEAVVNRLKAVDLRFCGSADQALARLRGALPSDKSTRKALEDLSALFSYLRVWRIEKHVTIDALMPPTESYYRELIFQIYLIKDSNASSFSEGTLFAVGGRYDYLVQHMWYQEYKSSPPGAVGISLALEKILHHSSVEFRPSRNEHSTDVLICARGGGGLLKERMELVAELWQAHIKAEFVPASDPSLTEQYEYANEHDVKCLVIVTESGLSQTDSVKVRHLELKKEKEVEMGSLVKFLTDAVSTQFRNLSIWN